MTSESTGSTKASPQLFHSLTYADADAGIAFLTAVGFTEVLVVRSSADASTVEHAQFSWRDNGGLMFGSVRDGNPHATTAMTGKAKCYCVVASDAEVDGIYDAAIRAGGTSVQAPENADYGGRGATVTDPEGNQFSFGSYQGE